MFLFSALALARQRGTMSCRPFGTINHMPAPSRRKRLLTYLTIVLGVLVILALLTPWRRFAEDVLRAGLEAQGLGQVRLTVDRLGLDGVKLRDIALGTDAPVLLPEATIGFSLADLWHGRLQSLRLDGLDLAATQQNGVWRLDGFDPSENTGKSGGLGFPVTLEQIDAVPLTDAALTHSILRLAAPAWSLALPFELVWQKHPAPKLTYQSANPTLKFGAMAGTAESMRVALAFDPGLKQWRGDWRIGGFKLQDAAVDVPILTGTGTVNINADGIKLDGSFIDSEKAWSATFKIDINPMKPAAARLTLAQGSLPWNGGTISMRDVIIPLSGKTDISLPLTIKAVSIDVLMQQLTGKKATAQGVVSGTVPVVIKADGTIRIDQGNLTAETPGVIAIDPAAIPGDNDQIALVREVLQNLHYTLLAIGIDNGADNKLAVSLTVEGKNPDAYNGRPIKLRVHLGGDVLEFVQQSLMSFTDPKQLLRQDDHDKK